jgi:hypothetical protein
MAGRLMAQPVYPQLRKSPCIPGLTLVSRRAGIRIRESRPILLFTCYPRRSNSHRPFRDLVLHEFLKIFGRPALGLHHFGANILQPLLH